MAGPIKAGDTFRVNFDRNNKQSPINVQLAKVGGLNYEKAKGVIRFGAFFVRNGGQKANYVLKKHFTKAFLDAFGAR